MPASPGARLLDAVAALPSRRWWLVLALAAAGVRVAWAIAFGGRAPVFDEVAYVAHAVDLAAGSGYVNEAGQPTAFWPVGYPAVLAVAYRILGTGAAAGIALQVVLGTAACFLVSAVGTRVFGPRVGRLAALGLSTYPTHVYYATLWLAEPLAAALVMAATWLVVVNRGRWAGLAGGVALGMATLARPQILALPVALPWWPPRGVGIRRWASAAVVSAGMLLAVMPWMARNRAVVGIPTLSTTGGFNFWMGNYPDALGGYRHDPAIMDRLVVDGRVDYDRGFRLGLEAIGDDPARAAARTLAKASYFFALETDGAFWNAKGLDPPPPAALTIALAGVASAGWIALVALALLGVLGSPGEPLSRWFVALTAYHVAVAMAFVGDPRYHFVLVPLAMIFAARGTLLWMDSRAARTGSIPGASLPGRRWIVGMGVFVALLGGNLILKRLEDRLLGPPPVPFLEGGRRP